MKTIKEIITAEKRSWIEGYSVSVMLDRIEAAATERIAELEKQLEAFKAMSKRILDMRMKEMEEICVLKERIAEGDPQTSKQPSHDVSPVWRETEFTAGMHCSCGQELLKWNYCPQCGAKLNWGDV